MTVIRRVTKSEMKGETGLSHALGYAKPDDDEILIRKNLPKELEKEVLAHEEEHILNNEEGPFLGSIIGAVGAIGSSLLGSRSAKKATDAQTAASQAEIDYARETRDLARKDQEPYIKAGHKAIDALMSMTGLATPSAPRSTNRAASNVRGAGRAINISDYLRGLGPSNNVRIRPRFAGGAVLGAMGDRIHYMINEMGPENHYSGGAYRRNSNPQQIDPSQDGYVKPGEPPAGVLSRAGYRPPQENPGGVEGGYNFMTDPGYEFRVDEGMRALDRGAAAAGGLLSGGYGRRAIRYGQDYASNEYSNVYNRISNIAGLGQVANNQYTGAALATSGQVGNAMSNAGYARASGYTAQGNAWGNAINEVAQLPWGDLFGGGGSSSNQGGGWF